MKRCFCCFNNIEDNANFCPKCGYRMDKENDAKWALEPGTVLNNKYLVGKMLGEGGFGITYAAWDLNMEIRVAIKEYYPRSLVYRDVTSETGNTIPLSETEDTDYAAGLKRYVKEASTLSRFFDLPGIVSVKDFFYENETAYMVMEYLDGGSLGDYLKRNGEKLKYDEALRLVRPIILSLETIHGQNILHRDISPDNIMLDHEGNIKLIDFGAARYFSPDNENSMTVMLKHGYAPIEQYSRNGNQGPATDVYGICAVIYRMITGEIPIEAIERARGEEIYSLKDFDTKIPVYISDTIQSGLEVMPEDRIATMQALYDRLYASSYKRLLSAMTVCGRKALRVSKYVAVAVFFCVIAYTAFTAVKKRADLMELALETSEDVPEISEKSLDSVSELSSSAVEELNEGIAGNKETTDTEGKSQSDAAAEYGLQEHDETEYIDAYGNVISRADYESIQHGIIVARDGVLNGYSTSLTVGEILNTYADYEGQWAGACYGNNELHIYYQSQRQSETFIIDFEVFADDTFKVAGVLIDNSRIDNYSEYFQNILNEIL